ncbi:MAG: tetratricopeptide repeat-containing sensor histidine kinase [Ignavibacteria bacterium]|nr:tetratricopeptide repeat-containing sensor histidine kinase [Ignavibacteria bacterium]
MRILFIFFVFCFTVFAQIKSDDSRLAIKQKLEAMNEADRLTYLLELSTVFRDSAITEGISYVKQGIDLSRKLGKKEITGELLTNLGFMYQNQYKFENALDCVVEALKIGNESKNSKILGAAYNVLGNYYYKRGSYDKSYEYFIRALKFRRLLGNKKDIAANLNNVGLVYLQLKNYSSALESFQQSLVLKNELKDYKSSLRTITNIELCYKETKQYPLAIQMLDSALKVCDILRSAASKSLVYSAWGDLMLRMGDPQSALIKYNLALENFNFMRYKKGTGASDMYISFANYYKAIKNLPRANQYLDTALVIVKKSNLSGYLPQIYTLYSDNYAALGDYKNEAQYRRLYSAVKDSLDSVEKSRIVTEMAALYSIEEKEQELQAKKAQLQLLYYLGAFLLVIVVLLIWINVHRRKTNDILRKQNLEIEKQKTLLEHSNEALSVSKQRINRYADELREIIATKDKFFSILAHDLRAPFQAILGLSERLVETSDLSEANVKKDIIFINQAAIAHYRLLENLLEWGKLQRGKADFSPEDIPLKKCAANVLDLLNKLADIKKILIHDLIPVTALVYADRRMLETVLRNLIANSIKFTHEGGEVSLSFDEDEKSTSIIVSDSGIGMPVEKQAELFKIGSSVSTPGTNNEKGTGLGLILCREIIEKHGGKITVKSDEQSGTVIILHFPKKM